ncbi:hypothetical protein QVD17_25153 [Tagetes erecta]|uniref:Uncharacterized protein n=1 Tax=Tagetes erecta TaxID=13708 RepID=A0AAD8KFR5_TARER|nr:hypothetical protein QVD17_25153 [Tagetes erecta]
MSSTVDTPNAKLSSPAKPKRAPLLPSHADNNRPRRPKVRDVSSRYLSSNASSDFIATTMTSNSICTPRRRFPSPLVSSTNVMTPEWTMSGKRAQTTERRRPGSLQRGEMTETAKRLTMRSLSVSFEGSRHVTPVRKTKSVDFTNENENMNLNSKLKPNKPEFNTTSVGHKLFSDSYKSDRVVSDAVSVSCGKIRGAKPGVLMVPVRFRQESVSPPLSPNNKENVYLKDVPALSAQAVRPASPRGMVIPARVWGGIGSTDNVGNMPSIFSFAPETRRRRKVGDNATIADTHKLRMLHNKYFQWRFVNARAEAAMSVQRATAQKSLHNSLVTTSKMRQSVIFKQIEIQQLRQNLKLYTVLKNQVPYLKAWDQVGRDHLVILSETIVSLESSTLCLPLIDGAKANIQSLGDAMQSVADVMHAMTPLIRSLVTKVEHVNTLAAELANTTREERFIIDECKELLSILTHMEVQDCSLRTHELQLERATLTTTENFLE